MENLSKIFKCDTIHISKDELNKLMPKISDAVFRKSQSMFGKIGGLASYNYKTEEEKKEWHRKGGKASSLLRNKSGWKMSNQGKINIKNARLKSAIYPCPHGCKTKRGNTLMDGGNLKLHMLKIHGVKG